MGLFDPGSSSEVIVSLMQEMVRAGVYKRTQGKITRQVTFAALFISIALGCWQLSLAFKGTGTLYQYAIPSLLTAVGAWFAYRLVNYPVFADFLIAVEAEMVKVNWPSRKELFRASIVVLVTMVALAVILFLYDMIWKFLLYDVLNISNRKPPTT
jgi:preprotein translocase subunit SecE